MKRIWLALIACALFSAPSHAQRRSITLDGVQIFLDIPAEYKFEKREKVKGKDWLTFRASPAQEISVHLLDFDSYGGFKRQTAQWRADYLRKQKAQGSVLELAGAGPNYRFFGSCDTTDGCYYFFEQLRVAQQLRLFGSVYCEKCDLPRMKAAGALVQRLAKPVE